LPCLWLRGSAFWFYPLFKELGVTPASKLVDLPGGTEVLVAGVRCATHTPPMRSGKRVVFLSLDDGSGPVANVVFFHDAQAQIGAPVFRTHYALIRGRCPLRSWMIGSPGARRDVATGGLAASAARGGFTDFSW
jgi:hypothetical protein